MINTLIQLFPKQPLGLTRTLMEWDFYDAHYRFFEQVEESYLKSLSCCRDDLIEKYGFNYSSIYLTIAINAIHHSTRPQEHLNDWTDVTFGYLYEFSQSCGFLCPKGFAFFIPAVLYFKVLFKENKQNEIFDLQPLSDEIDKHIDGQASRNFLYFIEDFQYRFKRMTMQQNKELFTGKQLLFIEKVLFEND